jgi:hypothetical protein
MPEWGDPAWFTFPTVDGQRDDLGVATYFIDGFLHGRDSGHPYAFMVIFTDMWVLRKRVRASFYTFALYDLEHRRYGTYTDYDFPRPPRIRSRYKLRATRGHLALHYESSAGICRWENRRDEGGQLVPFAWEVVLPGLDHHGARMRLELAIDAARPPAPLGGSTLGGEMMFLGAPGTYSYFQSGLCMRGRLQWGDRAEDVEGNVGWIDRQWAVDDFSVHQDRHSSRYRHEWRVMQFDDGWDMSCFHQYQRDAGNTVVPWTGLSAQGPPPGFVLRATERVDVDILEFIRSPGLVRGTSMLTEGPRYFPHRYRLRVGDWGMDVRAQPLVDAPAHALPIEYWTGPVRLQGVLWDQPVTGWGFDERCRPWARGDEIARALQLSLEHQDGLDEADRTMLAYRLREVEALALRGDPAVASAHARRHVVARMERLPPATGTTLMPLVEDLLVALSGRFPIR